MKADCPPHIVFAGGGTGGHLFPGLAVAERLAADLPYARITFAGPGKRLERRLVAQAGFDYLALPCHRLPQRLRELAAFLLDNLAGYRAAVRFIRWHRARVVVGLGGYASVPMARAARRSRCPLVLLEQNVVPGRATRWLARSATLVCTAFEGTGRYLRDRCTVRVTGNPIREGFFRRHAPPGVGAPATPESAPGSLDRDPPATSKSRRQLVILGGSGGARSLNQSVPRALARMRARLAGWRIIHQSGQRELEFTRQAYRQVSLDAAVVPFLSRVPAVLARSDLAICRAGGTTLAELAAAGVPAVLLPYPYAADDHQRKNADVFTAAGACLCVDERQRAGPPDDHLARVLADLVSDDAKRADMAEAIGRLAQPDATWDVATIVRHLAAATTM